METEHTKVRSTPRDFFLHLGLIVTLYLSVGSLLSLLFEIINYKFPDALNPSYGAYYDPYSGAVRWAIAMLIITFPLFWLISWLLNRDYRLDPSRKAVGIRKWLIYLTLFLAGLSMMIDLVVLVNTFLGGEISARFILKVLSVLVVAGLVFGYYIYDLKKYPTGPSKMLTPFLSGAGLLIVLIIIGGFAVMGSPATQRKMQFDMQRTNDLQTVQQGIVNYWQKKQSLPNKLNDINDPLGDGYIPADPETKQQYEYKATGPLSFELCATFDAPSSSSQLNGQVTPYMPGMEDNWTHAAGHQCFTRTIDPQLYPPTNSQGIAVPKTAPTAAKPPVPAQQ